MAFDIYDHRTSGFCGNFRCRKTIRKNVPAARANAAAYFQTRRRFASGTDEQNIVPLIGDKVPDQIEISRRHMDHKARAKRQNRDVSSRKMIDKGRSEEHTSELQSLMRISYAVFCLKKK